MNFTPADIITGAKFQALATICAAPPIVPEIWSNAMVRNGEWNPVRFSEARNRVITGMMKDDIARFNGHKVIFCYADYLSAFVEHIFPHLTHRFVLIVHNGDTRITKKYYPFLEDERLICLFAVNCLIEHHKLVPLPLGIPNNTDLEFFCQVQQSPSEMIGNEVVSLDRINGIYCNFRDATNLIRPSIRLRLANDKRCFWSPEVLYDGYLSHLKRFKFVLSPPGSAPDCFRTWEALYMGSTPIIEPWLDGSPFRCGGALEVRDLGNLKEVDVFAEYYVPFTFALKFDYWKKMIENHLAGDADSYIT